MDIGLDKNTSKDNSSLSKDPLDSHIEKQAKNIEDKERKQTKRKSRETCRK